MQQIGFCFFGSILVLLSAVIAFGQDDNPASFFESALKELESSRKIAMEQLQKARQEANQPKISELEKKIKHFADSQMEMHKALKSVQDWGHRKKAEQEQLVHEFEATEAKLWAEVIQMKHEVQYLTRQGEQGVPKRGGSQNDLRESGKELSHPGDSMGRDPFGPSDTSRSKSASLQKSELKVEERKKKEWNASLGQNGARGMEEAIRELKSLLEVVREEVQQLRREVNQLKDR